MLALQMASLGFSAGWYMITGVVIATLIEIIILWRNAEARHESAL